MLLNDNKYGGAIILQPIRSSVLEFLFQMNTRLLRTNVFYYIHTQFRLAKSSTCAGPSGT